MIGRVCVVTGATSGIGRVTAEALAARGATVLVVGRDPARVRSTVDAIRAATGNPAIEGFVADLSSQTAVRRLADDVAARHDRVNVLVNNAGGIFTERSETVDGIERTFALNHLGPFLLTDRLLPLLRAGAPARVVNVSSSAHRYGRLNFGDLEGRRRYVGWLAYGQSKLANVLFTFELARRLAGSGITANALHPGLVATGFGRNNHRFPWPILFRMGRPFCVSAEAGARTSIYLASAPEVETVTGRYFARERAVGVSRAAERRDHAARLWELSVAMTGGAGAG
jgi:NAD(P)-dependent dehydrogenase (short-subunit alcohol dehydrogenase family)